MALVARTLIETARDRSPLFTRERHPDLTLLRILSQEERRITSRIIGVNASAIAATDVVSLAAYDFEAGHDLPAHQLVHSAEIVLTDADQEPFPAIRCNWHNRLDTRFPLSYAIHGGTLFLARTAEQWADVDHVNVSYAPLPTPLASLTATLAAAPDNADLYLSASLAVFMAAREKDLAPAEKGEIQTERLQAEKDLLDAWRQQSVAKIIRKHPRR